jgi:hypothetical protein
MNALRAQFFSLLIAILLVAPACGGGVSKEEVQRDFDALIKACAADDFTTAAAYVPYTGRADKARRYKDCLNPEQPEELVMAKKLCVELLSKLGDEGSYKIESMKRKAQKKGTWYAIFAKVKRDGVEASRIFAFRHIKGKFVLGDID